MRLGDSNDEVFDMLSIIAWLVQLDPDKVAVYMPSGNQYGSYYHVECVETSELVRMHLSVEAPRKQLVPVPRHLGSLRLRLCGACSAGIADPPNLRSA